jgi:alpha-L-arabinofuranosidase
MKNAFFLSRSFLTLFFLLQGFFMAWSQEKLTIDIGKKGPSINPHMWGLFFEDINFAADGGLYAEMIKNNSFEFPSPFMGWRRIQENGAMGYHYTKIYDKDEANKRYLQLQRLNNEGQFGMSNEGFRGMAVKAGENYRLTFIARPASGSSLSVQAQIMGKDRKILAQGTVSIQSSGWQEYELMLKAGNTEDKVHFRILLQGEGELDLDLISLFPEDTWKGRKRGLRKDLVELLADLKPGFLRFPGGCIVEGFDLETRYQWKKTIGEMHERSTLINRWNIEFMHRNAPDYFQSFGIGFFEYFLLAKDLGAEPLPILSCGLACQFNSGEMAHLHDMDEYVQDALDLIEFANGATDTHWGAKRAEMGHPEPFNLKYMGVGNENWGPQFIERFDIFEKALKAAYPEIILVSTSGPFPDGHEFDYLWKELTARNAELIDEHYYRAPQWFLDNARRYDSYDRDGPKVFAGEYAAHSTVEKDPLKKNNWEAALSEAAFMTGLERNADVVRLASYAPLFAHVDGWQWSPDLIWFDNLKAYATPNYYVQKLFANHPGTHIIPITLQNQSIAGENGLYASSTFDENTGELIFKIVNINADIRSLEIEWKGRAKNNAAGILYQLASDDLRVHHSPDKQDLITIKESPVQAKGKKLSLSIPANSVNVFRMAL